MPIVGFRNPRAVGKAYKQMIKDWREALPAQSVRLTVPIAEYPPAEASPAASRKQDQAENRA